MRNRMLDAGSLLVQLAHAASITNVIEHVGERMIIGSLRGIYTAGLPSFRIYFLTKIYRHVHCDSQTLSGQSVGSAMDGDLNDQSSSCRGSVFLLLPQ